MSTKTREQNQTAQQDQMGDGRSKGQIATVAPPRLPYNPVFEERYGISGMAWRALVDAVYPSAKTVEGIILAVSYCKSKGYDVMKKMVHVVPVWSSSLGREVEGVWEAVAALRATAFRTGEYAGCDETQFGPMKTQKFEGEVGKGQYAKHVSIELTFPEWAQVTVYRLIQGQRCSFPGPKVYFKSAYGAQGKSDVPNDKWAEGPEYMLEKCAEAAALRKAFPEALGSTNAAEEMEGRRLDITPGVIIDAEPAPPKPTRQTVREAAETTRKQNYEMDREYRGTMSGEGPVRTPPLPPHDEHTGEVDERQDDPAPDSEQANATSADNPHQQAPDGQAAQEGTGDAANVGEYDAIEDRLSGLITRAATLSNLNKIIGNNDADLTKLKASKTGHHDRVMQKIDDRRKWFAR